MGILGIALLGFLVVIIIGVQATRDVLKGLGYVIVIIGGFLVIASQIPAYNRTRAHAPAGPNDIALDWTGRAVKPPPAPAGMDCPSKPTTPFDKMMCSNDR